jgi:ubiquilin
MGMMGGQGGMGGMGGMMPPGMGGMPGMNPQMMAQMEAMMGGNPGAGAGASATADSRPPREKYASELTQIKEMGFADEELILQELVSSNGNVSLALERLFASMN